MREVEGKAATKVLFIKNERRHRCMRDPGPVKLASSICRYISLARLREPKMTALYAEQWKNEKQLVHTSFAARLSSRESSHAE
jgi:hypothetical protein